MQVNTHGAANGQLRCPQNRQEPRRPNSRMAPVPDVNETLAFLLYYVYIAIYFVNELYMITPFNKLFRTVINIIINHRFHKWITIQKIILLVSTTYSVMPAPECVKIKQSHRCCVIYKLMKKPSEIRALISESRLSISNTADVS